MPDVETSRPTGDLTEGGDALEDTQPIESPEGSAEPAEDDKEKIIVGFQKSLQKSQEARKKAEAELRKYKEKEKQEELADMSETDKIRVQAEKIIRENAELKIGILVDKIVGNRNIPAAVVTALKKVPWEIIPGVKEEVSDDADYDDVIDAIERHLPDYIDSLVISESKPDKGEDELPSVEPSTKKVDTERTGDGGAVVKTHKYTRREVERIKALGEAEYEKHREAILAQIGRDGGTLPE
jgi:hypothetical protein